MSVTSQLKDLNSDLWVLANAAIDMVALDAYIAEHNARIAQITPLASPYWAQSDHALTGSAVIHMAALLANEPTLVHRHVNLPADVMRFVSALPVAQGALVMALLEQRIRAGNASRLMLTGGKLALPGGVRLLGSNDLAMQKTAATIQELEAIRPNIEAFMKYIVPPLSRMEFHAIFGLSGSVGGADCNLLLNGNTIIDFRTSRKRQPLNRANMVQQLIYALFAKMDGLDVKLAWFYTRHCVYIELPPMFRALDVVQDAIAVYKDAIDYERYMEWSYDSDDDGWYGVSDEPY